MHNLRHLIGVPFADGGRTERGADCWGMVLLTFKEFGIELPDYKIHCFDTMAIGGQIDQERPQWIRIETPETPCLIVMCLDPNLPGVCNHLGVYVGLGMFLHTLGKRNSVLERLEHPYFSRKIEGFYRYAG
jgi:cell wall-associated NlpC family hydrolase